eukprot:m.114156 g.114156  ORF g.114156 m.114156 type:complete len:67 (-) comp51892_c0_seq2:1567-1767(-)
MEAVGSNLLVVLSFLGFSARRALRAGAFNGGCYCVCGVGSWCSGGGGGGGDNNLGLWSEGSLREVF